MDNNKRTKHLLRIVATQFFIGLIMFSLGLSLVFYAEGYRLRLPSFHIEKTGLLYLATNTKTDSEVLIGGKLVSQRIPYSQNLSPGRYEVVVNKNGFHSWQNLVQVEAELVSDFRTIILFRTDPIVSPLTDETKIKLLNAPIDTLARISDHKLTYGGYEIWDNDRLVTRFSKPVNGAIWYPDDYHIVYQQDNNIRIIEKTGTNDTLLVSLKQNSPTRFALSKDGNELYYIDSGEYYMAMVR